MNDYRRKSLDEIKRDIDALSERLQLIQEDEQTAFDNMPDSLALSERGERAEAAIDAIESAIGFLEDAQTMIDEACE